jgi:hypothetical protein
MVKGHISPSRHFNGRDSSGKWCNPLLQAASLSTTDSTDGGKALTLSRKSSIGVLPLRLVQKALQIKVLLGYRF